MPIDENTPNGSQYRFQQPIHWPYWWQKRANQLPRIDDIDFSALVSTGQGALFNDYDEGSEGP